MTPVPPAASREVVDGSFTYSLIATFESAEVSRSLVLRALAGAGLDVFEDEPDNLVLLAKEMNSPNFGLCFDTGHFNLFARPSLTEWLRAIKSYILLLHIHDNNTQADEHIVPGDGTFDFSAFFRELKGTECVHTIEMHNIDDVLKSMERIKTYI